MTRVYFDDSCWSDALRANWRARFARLRFPTDLAPAEDADSADLVIDFGNGGCLINGPVFNLPATAAALRHPAKTIAWNGNDQPTGLLPGLYASLDQRLFDSRWHATFPYPLHFNQAVRPRAPAEAVMLAGFTGGLNAPVRHRMAELLRNTPGFAIRITDGIWGRILFSAAEDEAKVRYADDLSRVRFALCPKGNGLGTIRFYEALETGRVPVVISDRWMPPADIDWSRCMIRVPESEIAELPKILARHDARWPEMAAAATTIWHDHFSDSTLLATLSRLALPILDRMPRHSSTRHRIRLAPAWAQARVKSLRRRMQTLRRPR